MAQLQDRLHLLNEWTGIAVTIQAGHPKILACMETTSHARYTYLHYFLKAARGTDFQIHVILEALQVLEVLRSMFAFHHVVFRVDTFCSRVLKHLRFDRTLLFRIDFVLQ